MRVLSRAGWWSMWLTLVALFLGGALGCGGGELPTLPPPDDPAPQPSVTPPPLPWPQIAFPLRASGSKWVDSAGRTVWRWGAWDLYGPGWTVPDERHVRALAEAGVNWTGIRLGPQAPSGPDGMHALPQLWGHVDAALSVMQQYGIVAEVALFDAWVIQHGHSYYPEWSFDDFKGRALTSSQAAWLRETAAVLRPYRHVVLLDGNEMFKAKPSLEWALALKAAVRRELPGVLLGTNSHNRDIERQYDWVARHQDMAVGALHGKPTAVNESGPDLDCMDWARESQYARRLSTAMDLWRSDVLDGEPWTACLAKHAEIRRASGK